MTDWYPRARVVLFIRFEEYGSKPSTPVPGKKQLARKGTGGGELKVTVDPESPPGKTRYLLTSEKSGGKESSPDGLSQPVVGIAPKNAKLQLNGLKQASTLDLEFSYLDAPFDPRCIRSCAIEYYFGTLTEDECARAAGDVVFLPDSFVDANGVLRSNRRFTGWVDSWEVDVKDGNPATIHLQCRDSRQVLIDQQSPPQLKVDTKTPLDKAIANYLSAFPQFDGLAVEYRGDGEAPTLDGVMQGPHKQGQGPAKGDKSSVWDYLVDMAGMVGCILFMQEQTVVIAKPRTVLGSGNVREDDPYDNSFRELRGMHLLYRTFIYGENIKDMSFGRKFNAAAPSNVEVRCYLGSSKKTIVVRFPDVQTTANPGNAGDKKWMVWRMAGISDPAMLKIAAQSIYEQGARKELSVKLTTHELSSYGGDVLDPDALDLQPGDPIEVYVNAAQQSLSELEKIEDTQLAEQRLIDFLVGLGHNEKLARVYARVYVDNGFQTTFRTRTVRLDYAADSGVSMEIEAVNFVEVRYDKEN